MTKMDLAGYMRGRLMGVHRDHLMQWLALEAPALDAAKTVAAQRAALGTTTTGATAVIPVHGGITHRADFFSMLFGGAPIQGIRRNIRQAMTDDAVSTVILEFDSPGGTIDGVPELADEILELRASSKRVVAHVNTLSASAAYWLASQTDEIIMSPSAETGSIGVFTVHEDVSEALAREGIKVTFISAGEHKVDGNPYEPLTDATRGPIQKRVNDVNAMFVAAVARGRGVTAAVVNETFGQGLVFGAKEAVRLGMADSIATLDETIVRMGSYQRKKKRMAAEAVAGDEMKAELAALFAAANLEHEDSDADTFASPDVAASEPDAAPEPAAADDTDYRRTRLSIAKRRQARPDAA